MNEGNLKEKLIYIKGDNTEILDEYLSNGWHIKQITGASMSEYGRCYVWIKRDEVREPA